MNKQEQLALLLEKLEAVKSLLSDADRWCRGDAARTSDGLSVNPMDPRATHFDLFGAVMHACSDTRGGSQEVWLTSSALFLALPPQYRLDEGLKKLPLTQREVEQKLVEWNDGVVEEQHEVIDLIDAAIANARQGELF